MRSGSVEEKVQGAGISDRAEKRGWRRRWTRRNVAAVTLLVYASIPVDDCVIRRN